jgi:hypothetical protein
VKINEETEQGVTREKSLGGAALNMEIGEEFSDEVMLQLR